MDQVQKLEISQHTAFLAVSWSLYWNLFTAEHVKNVMTILMWMWFWVIPPSQLAKDQDDNDDSRDPSQRDWATKNFNQRHFDPGWGDHLNQPMAIWWYSGGSRRSFTIFCRCPRWFFVDHQAGKATSSSLTDPNVNAKMSKVFRV